MKKVGLLAILTMAFVCNMQAQIGVEAGVSVGFINEVTVEGVQQGFDENTDVHYSFVGGITYNQKLLAGLSVQGGLYYMGKGVEYNITPNGGTMSESTYSIPYVELQILPKYSISILKSGICFMAGPYFAQRVGGNVKIKSTDGESHKVDCDDYLSKKDYGITFGIGCKVRSISLTAKYDMGLANILDEATSEEYPGKEYKTMTGSLVLGYTF